MALAAVVFVTWHARAGAADHEPIDLERMPLEQLLTMEVYGASKFVQKISDAPSAVAIVTAADIKAFGWRTLADVLRTIRGMHVSDDRNYTYLGARGFMRPGDYNTRFLLLVDGYRTNDAVFDQAAVGHDFILDLDLIDRIEYMPGTGSSIYGANAFFGVINVITKRGRDIGETQVAFEAGSAGMRQARATYGRRDANGVELLVSASAYRRDGKDLYFREFDTPETNDGVAKGLDYERVERVFVKMASGAFGITMGHVERTKGVPTASFNQVFNDPHSRTVDMHTFVDIGHRNQIATDLEFSAHVYAARYKYYGNYVYGPPAAELHRDGADARWWGAELKWVSTGFDRHKLVFGAEYQHDYRRDQSDFALIDGDPPRQATLFDDHRHGHRVGAYIQDEFTLREDLLFNAGVRHDYNSASGGVTNPRMALIYKPLPATTAKLIYGTAFRAPNAYEMYYEVPGGGGQRANLSLRAERIRTRELVLEHQLTAESRVTAQLFHSTVSSLISLTTVPDESMLRTVLEDELLQFQNLDSVRTRGAALQYEHLWSNGARLRASASRQSTIDRTTGARLINSPSQLAKFNLSLPLAHDAWRAAFETLYVGRRKTIDAAVGGYWLANLSLFSARIAKDAELTVGVYNLFDRRYADPGSEEHDQDAIAQDGRTFRIKLSYGF